MNGIIGRYERTANLADYKFLFSDSFVRETTFFKTYRIAVKANTQYTLKSNAPASVENTVTTFLYGRSDTMSTANDGLYTDVAKTITSTDDGYVYIAVRKEGTASVIPSVSETDFDNDTYTIMLNEGSTALPYAPYGSVWNDIPYSMLETATDVVTSLPVTVYVDGETDISLLLKGNTETSGTPSPQNPITIDGVGNKTANKFDVNGQTDAKAASVTVSNGSIIFENVPSGNTARITYSAQYAAGTYHVSCVASGSIYAVRIFSDSSFTGATYNSYYGGYYRDLSKTGFSMSLTFDNDFKIGFISNAEGGATFTISQIMLSTTEADYEPYGYKVPVLKDSSPLTPIYVLQQLMKIGDNTDTIAIDGTVTYNIKKLVLTGQESFWTDDGTSGNRSLYRILPTGTDAVLRGNRDDLYCTHFKTDLQFSANSVLIYNGMIGVFIYFYVLTADYPTLADFKTYIQQQYAAGTPVVLYYILATATSESIAVPTIPTTGGEFTLDIDTTVKPSELDLTYHGWHEHQPKKKSANLFDGLFEQGTLSESSSSGSTYAQTKSGADTRRIRTTNLIRCNGECTISANFEKYQLYLLYYDQNGLYTSQHSGSWQSSAITINYPYVGIAVRKLNNSEITPNETDINLMVNSGSTPLPYAPYWE